MSRYKYLSPVQKRIIKAFDAKNEAEKFLYGHAGFYTTTPRNSNGNIQWNLIDNRTLDLFEISNSRIKKFNEIDEIKACTAIHLFNETQFNIGQSF